jgi:hypothetical protein
MDKERYYLPYVHINPTKISVVPEQILGPRPTRKANTYKENFKEKGHKNKISKSAGKKISKALDYLIYCAKDKIIPEGYRGAGLHYKIGFVTLTMCSKQIHSDATIIREVLEPLLNYLRKHYKMKSYIWRAEKQKNGNLHFHLVTDVFLPWLELRNAWNKYQQNLGYVTRYAALQKEWHKTGFQVRKKLLKYWSAESQFKAYCKGQEEDWNNPNSADIHSIKKVKNVKKYICKYLSKNAKTEISDEALRGDTVDNILSISNRLWSCSEPLSKARGAKTDYTNEIGEELLKISGAKEVQTVITSNYSVYYIHISYLPKYDCPILFKLFTDYIKEAFP